MKTLTELANHYRSDKGSIVGAKHNYTPLYNFIMNPYRNQSIKILEIGLLRGGPELGHSADRITSRPPSIQMWLDYFPNAKIIGFDVSDFSDYETERFIFVRGDSGDNDSLQTLVEKHGSFDIVIDDASHASFHQLKAFERIFPYINSGGFYIIEDLHWQPKKIEDTLPKCPSGRDFLNWAMGYIADQDFLLPSELPTIRGLFNDIAFCYGFPGYRTGQRAIKTAVFAKS